MDLERASAQLDSIIESRAGSAGTNAANELEEMWKESERRHRERIRRKHAALWYEFEMCLAENHRQLAQEHESRALALLEMEGG